MIVGKLYIDGYLRAAFGLGFDLYMFETAVKDFGFPRKVLDRSYHLDMYLGPWTIELRRATDLDRLVKAGVSFDWGAKAQEAFDPDRYSVASSSWDESHANSFPDIQKAMANFRSLLRNMGKGSRLE